MGPSIRRVALRAASLVIALLPSAVVAAPSASAAAATSFPVALMQSLASPTPLTPPGANDWSCKPSAAHPRPVVLLHGTYANPYNSFAAMAPALRNAGWCVFAPALGASPLSAVDGWRPVEQSAEELAAFVDRVLTSTGAAQVDLVGYSQGGLVARTYLTDPAAGAARRAKVRAFVGLSVPNHGTTLFGLSTIVRALNLGPQVRGIFGQGGLDLLDRSPFMRTLAARGETIPGVATTMIATQTDEISVPGSRAWLAGSAADPVTNVWLQRGCPLDLSDHFSITYSPRSITLVRRALDPATRVSVPCSLRFPVI